MRTRVVLAVDSAKQRALVRLGLELCGEFDVVGVAADEADVEFIVASLRPDVVLIDFPNGPHRGLRTAHVVRGAGDAVPVLYDALMARHAGLDGQRGAPRPIEIAGLLRRALAEHPAPAAVASAAASR